MTQLTPRAAAELAKDIYLVQNEMLLPVLLSRAEFSINKSEKAGLTAKVGGRFFKGAKDGFGICAMGGKGYEKDLFMIFRGSTGANNNADWISNARIGVQLSSNALPVHIGFNEIFKSMLPSIKTFLNDNKGNIENVHCVGHSLGGAIATLAADWIKSRLKKNVKLYTFGAPKPGLMLFATNLTQKLKKENIFRTYHATDPVPMIPVFPFVQPPLPGYGHYIPSSESIISANAHDMKNYLTSVKETTWKLLERRSPPFEVESMVEEWLRSKSPVNSGSHKIWQWINSGIIYVLKKISGPLILALQAGLIGVITIADLVAMLLIKGLELITAAGEWIYRLIVKMMQAVGMAVVEVKDISKDLMRRVLTKVMEKTNEEARKAIKSI